ncbi:RbsD/FucU family protein [Rhodoferax sp.]|jgi:L-fucose mutarotase|uniref:RbsD/FucU family protein n=1 Tax=Rhodoferax sp. TaxID=50421 RepID=UPI0037838142
MLKGLDPLLTPDLVKVLMEMGHDDTLVLADANFTAHRLAQGKPLLRLPGTGMVRVVQAVTSVLPLVADEIHPVGFMQVSGQPEGYLSALQREVMQVLSPQLLPGQSAQAIERFAFYERTRSAYAIVLTGELQPYGNFLLRKGVIGETLRP